MPGRIAFDVNFSTGPQGQKRRGEESPMQILLMGDFHGHRAGEPDFHLHRLDADNFTRIMAKISPHLELTVADNPSHTVAMEFKTLDDFHPDQLFDRLGVFQALRDLRANLNNPNTFQQAAAQLGSPATSVPDVEARQSPPTGAGEDQDLLENLLGERDAHIANKPTAIGSARAVDISAFIKSAVAPHIEAGTPSEQDQYVEMVDNSITELMLRILHHPQFQALEAVWRGTYECITRLELDESLRVYILDASKEQILGDMQQAGPNLSGSSLYQTIVEKSVEILGGESWSLLAGFYEFSNQSNDIELLKGLGQLAYGSGGPFIAGARPQLLGCESLIKQSDARQWQTTAGEGQDTAWSELRDQPYANWLGLTFPRFLLRLPYGSKSEQIERFQFEEMAVDCSIERQHAGYLWGNTSVVCAILIAQSYQQSGWTMELGDVLELGDLPWHVYEFQGEKIMTPCAEVVMSEHSAEAIENQGVMPVMSYKDRNSVRLWRFRSLSRKNAALAGPWWG